MKKINLKKIVYIFAIVIGKQKDQAFQNNCIRKGKHKFTKQVLFLDTNSIFSNLVITNSGNEKLWINIQMY